MASDISRNVVAVLLVLTVVVSAIGTYAVVSQEPTISASAPGSTGAEVSLDIAPRPSDARVSLDIAEPTSEA